MCSDAGDHFTTNAEAMATKQYIRVINADAAFAIVTTVDCMQFIGSVKTATTKFSSEWIISSNMSKRNHHVLQVTAPSMGNLAWHVIPPKSISYLPKTSHMKATIMANDMRLTSVAQRCE